MPEPYVVRFKILKLECNSLSNGQQYTVTYRRGETYRSTPCYIADGGVVDFSSMPEGAAVVHFKNGGARFHPKWITFRVEEYTRGRPRRPVGETQLDCAEVLGGRSVTAAATRRVRFDIYGTPAHMVVALLVYPMSHPALSFSSIIPNSNSATDSNSNNNTISEATRLRGNGEIKRMARGEAMTLLISLETMLERRRADNNNNNNNSGAGNSTQSTLERRIAELEERRRSIAGVEGLAASVVKRRVEDVITAQFIALARQYRANFVGEVAAYLRQLAVASGVPLTADFTNSSGVNSEDVRGQLQRLNTRIDTLTQQVRKLEGEQESIGRLQGRADVTNELCAISSKVETLQSQIQLLIKSRATLEDAARGKGYDTTPIGREVQEIQDRINTLNTEEQQLSERINRMIAIASNHVLKWARSKNPPTQDLKSDLSSLFSSSSPPPPPPKNQKETQQQLNAEQRHQIMEALSTAAKVSAPVPHSDSSSEDEKTIKRPQPELFGAKGLPSLDDFGGSAKKAGRDTTTSASSTANTKPTEKHVDPYISDLGKGMFAPKPEEQGKEAKSKLPVFDFSASAPNDDYDNDDITFRGGGGGFGGFGGSITFGGEKEDNSPDYGAAATVQVLSMDDDPMYDFQPPADAASAKPISFEIDDSSFHQAVAGITSAVGTTYAFGTETQPVEGFSSSNNNNKPSALPTYNFGSDNAAKSDESGGISRLPTYNFGS